MEVRLTAFGLSSGGDLGERPALQLAVCQRLYPFLASQAGTLRALRLPLPPGPDAAPIRAWAAEHLALAATWSWGDYERGAAWSWGEASHEVLCGAEAAS